MNKADSRYSEISTKVVNLVSNFCGDIGVFHERNGVTTIVVDGITSLLYNHADDEYIIKCGSEYPCILKGKHRNADSAVRAFMNWL